MKAPIWSSSWVSQSPLLPALPVVVFCCLFAGLVPLQLLLLSPPACLLLLLSPPSWVLQQPVPPWLHLLQLQKHLGQLAEKIAGCQAELILMSSDLVSLP